MHELSVCQGLMRQLQQIAAEQGAAAVSKVVVHIGPLSGVEPQLLEQAFPLASAGTVAADAVLVMERLPVRVRCQSCGAESEAAPNRLLCAACGDWHTQLISGDELLLASVELDVEPPANFSQPASN
ncbi:MAG: hydrogenase maturation nickel metallochaperone HypA [Gammaproteobacteria bacterium]